MTPEMRVCRWCGYIFEGPSTRVAACHHCDTNERGFSVTVSNASPEEIVAAVPHLIEAVQKLRYALVSMGKEIAGLKARRT